MKKAISLLLASTFVLTSCGLGEKSEASNQFKTLYANEVQTLNYLNTTTEDEMNITANIVDTLVEYDHVGNVKPALATEWTQSEDGLTWTFKIRKGVDWVDFEGNKTGYQLTADDYVTGIKWQLEAENASANEHLLDGIIKNASQYFNGEIKDFNEVGVKALDSETLEITLERPIPYFLTMLTYPAYLPVNEEYLTEQGAAFGTTNENTLYNGAYILSTFAPNSKHILTKNENYWDKDNVKIESIIRTYNAEQETLAPELFLRGEVQEARINSDIIDDWRNDPEKSEMFRPALNGYYSYFYALNFNPTFDEEYEPENWKKAVNNLSFRKSLFHGLDRKIPMSVDEQADPESRLLNTITPKNFVSFEGTDYTQYPALKAFTELDSFDRALALENKEKAMTELEGEVTFPVKVLMPYRSDSADWAKRSQLVEQQLEDLLGKDYIDIVLEAGPATGFLGEVRRPGKYAFMEVNWGPDYADPETYTDPFYEGGTYNKPEFIEGHEDSNGKKTYTNLVDAAREEVMDINARYNNFAEAEAYLIENAFVIPYAVNNPGYFATYLSPFDGQYAPFGMSYLKYKGKTILESPMDTEEFNEAKLQWEAEKSGQ